MRKIDAMHYEYGRKDGTLCRSCRHFLSGRWRDKRYHKCKLYGLSHSAATDWRLSYTGCGLHNDPKADDYIPLMEKLKRMPKVCTDEPIVGQVELIL